MGVGKRALYGCAVAACLAWNPFAVLCAQTVESGGSAAFAAASSAFADADFRRALANFQSARAAGTPGPAIDYNIGVCHYKLAEYAQAAGEFRELGERYPAMRALAQYNLGLSLSKLGRVQEARLAFEQALGSDDGKIAQMAALMLERLPGANDRMAAPAAWWGLFDLSAGHDSNVALADEASLPAGVSMASPFTEVFVVGSGPLGTRWRLDADAYLARYPDAQAFDQNAVRVGAAYEWTWQAWRGTAGPHYGRTTLGDTAFERQLGATLDLQRSWRGTSVTARLAHDLIAALDAQYSFVEGTRDRIGVTIDRRTAGGRWVLGYEHELNDRVDGSVSPTRDRLWMRYRYALSRDWDLESELSLRSSRYEELSLPRDERLTELALGAVRFLPRHWRTSIRYNWAENDSDSAVFSYTRSRIAVVLDKAF
jgi:tetratricopeptide (TPR) repeat protein